MIRVKRPAGHGQEVGEERDGQEEERQAGAEHPPDMGSIERRQRCRGKQAAGRLPGDRRALEAEGGGVADHGAGQASPEEETGSAQPETRWPEEGQEGHAADEDAQRRHADQAGGILGLRERGERTLPRNPPGAREAGSHPGRRDVAAQNGKRQLTAHHIAVGAEEKPGEDVLPGLQLRQGHRDILVVGGGVSGRCLHVSFAFSASGSFWTQPL